MAEGFTSEMTLNDDTLNVSLSGRLDTNTAPELMKQYRETAEKGSITNICLDMKDLEYISSAGLRVLLIMRKAVKDDSCISAVNMNETVRKIIKTTGFDTILSF